MHAAYDGHARDMEVGLAGCRPRATVATRRNTAECLQMRTLDPPKKGNSQLKDIQQQLSVSRLASSAKFTRTIDQGASPGEDSKNGIAHSSPVRMTCSEYSGWHSGEHKLCRLLPEAPGESF